MGEGIQSGGRGHHKLEAWKTARELGRDVYVLTRTFPREELFGLVAQMRRAAVAIPSNITEGAACATGLHKTVRAK